MTVGNLSNSLVSLSSTLCKTGKFMLQVDYIVCAFLFHDTDQESEQE